jgi:hypothetical protein
MNNKLVILFNHPHIKNIDTLDNIYRNRYGDIDYVVPMISCSKKNIITSYRGSYSFHGMILDYLLCKEHEILSNPSGFMIFCQDDVLINPKLDLNFFEKNILSRYGGFITPISNFFTEKWIWSERVYNKFLNGDNPSLGHGLLNFCSYLPNPEKIRTNFLENKIDVFNNLDNFTSESKSIVEKYNIPLVKGLSDFFIIKNSHIPFFLNYLKVFTALDIFPEVAIPTALAGSVNNLYSNYINNDFQSRILWGDHRNKAYDPSYVNNFFSSTNSIYLHPCKFSLLGDRDKYFKEINYV